VIQFIQFLRNSFRNFNKVSTTIKLAVLAGTLTNVQLFHQSPRIEETRKKPIQIALTSAQKAASKRKRETGREEVEEEDLSGDAGEDGYSCPEAGCSCVYLLEKQLQNHVDTGSHFFDASDVIHTSRGKRYRKTGAWIPLDRRSSPQTVNNEILTEVAVCTFPESHEDIQINTPIPQSSNTSSMNTFIFGFTLKKQ
jgi:hypothetical protein